MIILHYGLPGSGKSYEAVAFEVTGALEIGRKVVTNLPLNIDKIAEDYPQAHNLITVIHRGIGAHRPFSILEDYEQFDSWRHPDNDTLGPLFIIDEASQSLPAAGRGNVPEEVKFWFEEHRHTRSRVVLITQDPDYIVKSVRSLPQFSYKFVNMLALGWAGLYVKHHYSGPPEKSKKAVRKQWRIYNRKYFLYYNSFNKGSGSGNTRERHRPVWARPELLIGFLAIAFWVATCSGVYDMPLPGVHGAEASPPAHEEKPVSAVSRPVSELVAVGVGEAVPSHPLAGQRATLAVLAIDDRTTYLLSIAGQRWRVEDLRYLGYEVLERPDSVIIRWPGHAWSVDYTHSVYLR